MLMPLKVAVVENDKMFAEAVQQVLNNSAPDYSCVGVFTNGEVALKNLPVLKPDIVLMDIDLGQNQLSGIECITLLQPLLPETLFMILTVYEDHQKVFDALSAGALGYVLKSARPEKIIEALHELKEGGSPM